MLDRLDGRGARAEGPALEAAGRLRAGGALSGAGAAHAGLAEARGVLASAARSVGGEGAGEGVGGEAGRAVLREAAAELGRDLARLGARELGGLGDLLRAAFGAKAEGPAGRALGARLAAGEVPMPALRLVGDETLPAGARGAYSSQGEGTVFLHRDLMGDPAALRRVLAEELGHHLDRLLGGGDAKGDEGALFARLLAGERLGAGELAALRREDDRGRLRDGRAVELFSFGLGNASGGGLSFGGSATGGALDVGAGGGTELSFGEGVGAVGRDALTSAEGLSMGTTGAGSEGTTASSPRGELSLGERVSDDDEGTRTAKVAAAAVGLVPGVGAAADAQASADRQARWGDAQGRLPGSAEEWRERGAAMVEGWVERGAAGLAEMDRATREAAARAPGADGRPAPEAWALSFALGETAASGRGEAAFREGALQRAFELDPLGAAQGHAGSGLSFGRALSGESLTKQGVVLDGVAGGDVSKRAGKAIVSGLVGDAQVGALDGRARTAERRDRESALRHGLAASIAAVHGRGGRVEIAAGVEAIEAALATPEGLDYLRAAKALGAKERSEALAALAADPRAAVASAGEGAKGEAHKADKEDRGDEPDGVRGAKADKGRPARDASDAQLIRAEFPGVEDDGEATDPQGEAGEDAPFASTPGNRLARWEEAQAIRASWGLGTPSTGTSGLEPMDQRAQDYPYFPSSDEMIRGDMRTGGQVPARADKGASLTFDIGAVAEDPEEVATGFGKSLANAISETVELGAKAVGGAALAGPSWVSVQMADALGLDARAERNRELYDDVADAVWGLDVPTLDYETDAEETGALLGIVGTSVVGAAGLVRGSAHGAGAVIDEVAETMQPPLAPVVQGPQVHTRMAPGIGPHVRSRDPEVPRTSGIGGAHNRDEFERALEAEGARVVDRTPHPTVPGVEQVRYQMPKRDHMGEIVEGEFRSRVREKTIYDPVVISDEMMMRWGREAADGAMRSDGTLPNRWTGTTTDGVPMRGFAETSTNRVTSFFPDMNP